MVTNRRKKVVKYRGQTSHGCGHHKKRRGAGSRGGRGRAGSGKRAGHKKYGIVLGRHGFIPRRSFGAGQAINLSYFTENRLLQLVKEGEISKKDDVYQVNLNQLGYDKLLSTGVITVKVAFIVKYCSKKASEKVSSTGGNVKLITVGRALSADDLPTPSKEIG